jgi:hypothetical protein
MDAINAESHPQSPVAEGHPARMPKKFDYRKVERHGKARYSAALMLVSA